MKGKDLIPEFQFYDSPIKSAVVCSMTWACGSFNSMIVRLKVITLIGVVVAKVVSIL